jgi:hypothetical protein
VEIGLAYLVIAFSDTNSVLAHATLINPFLGVAGATNGTKGLFTYTAHYFSHSSLILYRNVCIIFKKHKFNGENHLAFLVL